MSVIYQPKGRAGEYAKWACNLYRGCPGGCAYCFAPSVLHMTRYEFHRDTAPRVDILERLHKDARKHKGQELMVHLCFTCDPYPVDLEPMAREAILTLHEFGHHVQILTKGGHRSMHDFDLLGGQDEYAATLTFDNSRDTRLWEPHTAPPEQRLDALEIAAGHGIPTWASLEPVIFPDQSLNMLTRACLGGVSKVKIGPLNYKSRLPKWLLSQVPDVDWKDFAEQAASICQSWGVEYLFKEDLKELIA